MPQTTLQVQAGLSRCGGTDEAFGEDQQAQQVEHVEKLGRALSQPVIGLDAAQRGAYASVSGMPSVVLGMASPGQLLDLNAVANDLGVAQTTARDWLTGLAAWLRGSTHAQTMNVHPMRGALFENLCIAEYGKHLRHTGAAGSMYFWRDNIGNEVDLLIERGGILTPVEFKSGATFQPGWLTCLHTWQRHAAQARRRTAARLRRARQPALAGCGGSPLA